MSGSSLRARAAAQTSSAAEAPAPPVRPRAWAAVAATIAAVAWGGNEFTPLLVMYRQVSGFTPVVVDALLAAYVVGIVPALLLGGPLSDLLGRRRLLAPAAPLSLLGSLLLSIGPDSAIVIGLGRVLCGLALGLAMGVGTAWVTELSERAGADPTAGARRASLSLTAGFLIGAGVAAGLAQWGPWPAHTTYLLHMALTVAAGIVLLTAPETVRSRAGRASSARERLTPRTVLDLLRVPAAAHQRFLRVVLPVGPWVFGAAGTAYAVLPAVLGGQAGSLPIAYAGAMTVVTLGVGVGIQSLGRTLDTARSARASVLAMGIVAVGMALAALAARGSLTLGFLAAAVLGGGYGLALVAGLSEVRRIAGADDLAGLTSVYYSLAYLGFFVPMVLAALAAALPYSMLLLGGTALALLTLGNVACAWRAHLPGARDLEEA